MGYVLQHVYLSAKLNFLFQNLLPTGKCVETHTMHPTLMLAFAHYRFYTVVSLHSPRWILFYIMAFLCFQTTVNPFLDVAGYIRHETFLL